MNIKLNCSKLFSFIILVGTPLHLWAYENLPDIAPFPNEVQVSKECALTNSDLKNCADNMTEMLDWVWATRQPSKASPLIIDIAPGRYGMPTVTCSVIEPVVVEEQGFTTFRGSGRETTRLSVGGSGLAAIDVLGCKNLSFQDLTVEANTSNGIWRFGIIWREGGSSSWSNVSVRSGGYGWYDTGSNFSGGSCQDGPPGRHEWYGSSIHNVASFFSFNVAYHSGCGDSWFWGSELLAEQSSSSFFPVSNHVGVDANTSTGSIHLYGTNVRVIAKEGSGVSGMQAGLFAKGNGGTIHHHGGEIVVRHEEQGNDKTVFGIVADGAGSRVHTLETSFGLLPAGNGDAHRASALNGGSVESAFQWVPSTDAPTPGDAAGLKHIISVDGQDSFVETDCPQSSGCQTTGSFPHFMIYSSACTGIGADQGPWFDTVTTKCRGF